MATLTGQRIKDTYDAVLKLEDNAALTSSPKAITDGLGNNTPISVSTIKVDVSSDLEAASFVKTSGLSTQFLKADGSVDSSAYLTSGDLPASHWSSNLVGIDYAGGNVGIGTTSPSTTLDVAGSITTSGALIGPALFEIIAQYANRGRITLNSSTNTSANQIALLTNGVPRMVVNKEGNVGIGTTSPSAKLHIQYDGGAGSGLYVKSNVNRSKITVADNDSAAYVVAEGGKASYGTADSLSANNLTIETSGNVGIGTTTPSEKLEVTGPIGSTKLTGYKLIFTRNANNEIFTEGASSTLTLGTNSVERMRINSAGNVGIGTSSPSSKLHVNGDARIGDLRLVSAGGADYIQSDANIRFSPVGTSSGTRMTILSTGNVGIGTTSPSEKLEVSGGNIKGDGLIQVENASNNNIIGKLIIDYGSSNNPRLSSVGGTEIDFQTNLVIRSNKGLYSDTSSSTGLIIGSQRANTPIKFLTSPTTHLTYSEAMRIAGDGNVGIGTTSPQGKLDISTATSGDIFNLRIHNLSGESAQSTGILFNAGYTDVSRGKGGLVYEYDTSAGWNRGDFHFLQRQDAGAGIARLSDSVVTIKNSGNVGIGTTSPSEKLHIEASDPRIKIVDTDGTNWQSEVFTQGGSLKLQARNGTNFGNISFQGDNGTTQSEYARFNSVGNLGIGTTSPSSKLQVEGAVKINQSADWNGLNIFGFDNQSTDYIKIHIGTTPMARYQSNLTHSFYVGNSRTLDISATNVGFRVSSSHPDDLLSIFGTNKDSYLGYSNTDDKFKIGFGSTSSPTVDINTQLSLDGAGVYVENNLGIGTTSPSQKLEVDGQVLSDGYRLAAMQTAPATRNSAGTLGEIVIDGNYIYVCYAASSWSRVALETSW